MRRQVRPVALAIVSEPPATAGGSDAALQFIDFRRQHEIAFADPVDLVRPDRLFGFTPAKADVRMMALLFCQIAHAVNEFEAFAKIFEAIDLLQMMLVNHLPALELRQKLFNFLALHGRPPAATWHASTFG